LKIKGEAEAMEEDRQVDPSVEVFQWLREVGRRRWPSTRKQDAEADVPTPPSRDTPVLRRTLLLALLLILALHYIYADTTVEILSIRSLLVFVFPD
jgi:hypothetical protein